MARRKHLDPNPSITTREAGRGARAWPLRPIRFHPEGAACRGEAAPRPYLLVAHPHGIDGLGTWMGRVSSANSPFTIYYFNVTMVAPQPPASGGASWKERTKGVRASTERTISRCTPIPRPWMMRRAFRPRRLASSRYASTASFTSCGRTACRSKTSLSGMRSGSSSSICLVGSLGSADPPALGSEDLS
jgi:hypothetical protein